MATDYDAPRRGDADQPSSRLCRPSPPPSPAALPDLGGVVDPVEGELAALAAVDPTDAELAGPLVPRQFDEFICTSCHLVQPNSRLVDPQQRICTDCAG